MTVSISKERVTITIDLEVLERIKILAEADDRSVSYKINQLLKERIDMGDLK